MNEHLNMTHISTSTQSNVGRPQQRHAGRQTQRLSEAKPDRSTYTMAKPTRALTPSIQPIPTTLLLFFYIRNGMVGGHTLYVLSNQKEVRGV